MSGAQTLWCEVLSLAVSDALHGAPIITKSLKVKEDAINADRAFLTVPNKNFDEVCTLAGLDPQAFREKLCKLIAAAPTANELVSQSRRRAHRKSSRTQERVRKASKAGVVTDFQHLSGTGVGTNAQETTNITFQDQTI